jgi:hypothetical protein
MDGPATIDMHWDWVSLDGELITLGLGGPTTIDMHWEWGSPDEEIITLGLGGPRTINSNQNGWAQNNQYPLGMGQPR